MIDDIIVFGDTISKNLCNIQLCLSYENDLGKRSSLARGLSHRYSAKRSFNYAK